jgi:hypothetical protein
MGLALGVTAIVVLALFSELARPRLAQLGARARAAVEQRHERRRRAAELVYDPGRELRAEQRARVLLRSCVNEEEWAMYRELGFLRVWGASRGRSQAEYAYLVYPHKPIVAYLPQTGSILGEYCVAFKNETAPSGGPRLPDADDVLAKWMLLAADERGLLEQANMHMPGRQVDPEQVRGDLARLGNWERARFAQRSRRPAPETSTHPPAMSSRRRAANRRLASRAGTR